jgi:phosphoglucosamine mutase
MILTAKEVIMSKLFGTDGIRGVANEYPMTSEMALKIGRAVALIFKKHDVGSKIIIGKDTRISGDMLEYAVASGICAMGSDVFLAGILPTPGIAFLTASAGANAGIVISASHNPFYDNGIKIFKDDGFKISDEKESEIERLVLNENMEQMSKSVQKTGRVYAMADAGKKYSQLLKKSLPQKIDFNGIKIVMDCSNGATFRVAPELFAELGADVEPLFVTPDGKNINDNCGSQHTEALIKAVREKNADIGLAFDGDGDRLVAVDENGDVVTGDRIIAICAKYLKQNERLKGNQVITTVMSNLGLCLALKNMNIKHAFSKVGDRHVVEKMISSGAVLGGEDSGHVIFLDHHTTGDGILTALKLIEVVKAESKSLSELSRVMTAFPQVLINVEVRHKPDLDTIPDIQDAIKSVEHYLGDEGRVLVRYSGTEPLCRVMVEGPTLDVTNTYCRQLADKIRENIGK